VSPTTFVTGAGTAPQTIPLTNISYWSRPPTATTGTTGTGKFTLGQLTAGSAVVLTGPQTAFSVTAASGVNSARETPPCRSWCPPGR